MRIVGQAGDRYLIAGQSGSGKSVATAFIATHAKQPVFVFDVKGEEHYQRAFSGHFVIASEADQALRWLSWADGEKVRAVIYQPMLGELSRIQDIATSLFRVILAQGNWCVVVDEAYSLGDCEGLVAALTRGRSLGVTTLVATQRPRWVTRFAFTEATHFFVFYLQDVEDKKRVAEFTAIKAEDFDNLRKFEFFYWAPGERVQKGKIEAGFLTTEIERHVWI
jgi:hypothetical protein